MPARKPTIEQLIERFFLRFDHFDPSKLFYFPKLTAFAVNEDGVLRFLDETTDLFYPLVKFVSAEKLLKDDELPQNYDFNVRICKDFLSTLPAFLPDHHVLDSYTLSHVALKDGQFLNVRTLKVEPPTERTIAFLQLPISSEEYFANVALPNTYPQQPTRFLQFLNEVLVTPNQETDYELLSFVQEMMGYLFVPQMDAQVAFFLYGKGANGKSVFLEILAAFYQDSLKSHMTLEGLSSSRFAKARLIGRLINIAGEDDSKYLATDLFKQLVTGEEIDAEKKFKDTFSFRPHVKLIFSVNDLPSFENLNFGLRRRLRFLPFNRTFDPHERDTTLASKIIENELPGIAMWALEGLHRLIKNNYQFTESQQMKKTMETLEMNQSSVIEYIKENFDLSDPAALYPKTTIYEHYKDWSASVGRKARPKRMFFKELLDRYKTLSEKKARPFGPETNPMWCIEGIDIKRDEDTWLYEHVLNAQDAQKRIMAIKL